MADRSQQQHPQPTPAPNPAAAALYTQAAADYEAAARDADKLGAHTRADNHRRRAAEHRALATAYSATAWDDDDNKPAPEAPRGCVECGTTPTAGRGRCKSCWRRHVKELKKAGTYEPKLSAQPITERLWGRAVAGWGGCIVWTGPLTRGGYGKIKANGRHTTPHRVAYELAIGPIPDGLQLDHACHTRDSSCLGGDVCLHRRCINPHHLEPVTPRENALRSPNTPTGANSRKACCASGHPFDEANTRIAPDGRRKCRQCELKNNQQRAGATPAAPVRETCRRGHPLTEDNIYRRGRIITCRICRRASQARFNEARKAGASAPTAQDEDPNGPWLPKIPGPRKPSVTATDVCPLCEYFRCRCNSTHPGSTRLDLIGASA